MRAAGIIAAALCACGPASLPNPTIVAIEPAEMVASDGAFVTVTVEAVLPFQVAYGTRTGKLDPGLTITFGGLPLGPAQYENEGKLSVPVPTVFNPGTYDVTVRLSDGREATAPQAFTVKPGLWPDGYTIDPIGAQRREQPFAVTIRATGANAAGFHGNVDLSVDLYQVSPRTSGNFAAGVRVQQVTMTQVNKPQAVILTVTDQQGHKGASNPFDVN